MLLFVGSVLLVLSTNAIACEEACLTDQPRHDCGYSGITQAICEERECCWSPKDNEPYCFSKTAVDLSTKVCPTDESSRSDCGYLGIVQQKCEDNHGCCWNTSTTAGVPWCFSMVDAPVPPSSNPTSPEAPSSNPSSTEAPSSNPTSTEEERVHIASEQVCLSDQSRTDCGYYGITQVGCEERGCCWNPKNYEYWCFNKTAVDLSTKVCPTDESSRSDCGYLGIDQQKCEVNHGCCWNSSTTAGVPWCFSMVDAPVPPSSNPTSTEAPSSNPSSTEAPSSNPTSTEAPSSNPTSTEAPSSNPSSTEAPSSNPSSTEAPSSNPSSTEAPSSNPSSTEAPSSNPNSTEEERVHIASEQVCLSGQSRTDCGYYGITQAGCEERGCCWSPKNYEYWCFNKTAVDLSTKVCPTNESSRSDCGYLGIDQQKCEVNHGCCWNSSTTAGVPWCFSMVDAPVPPSSNPSSTEAPSSNPTSTEAPSSNPTSTEAPSSNPTSTEAPSSSPSSTEAPSSNPNSTEEERVHIASEQVCLSDQPRTDCGYLGIDQQGCHNIGCCWSPKDNEPYCFNKTAVDLSTKVCPTDESSRSDCGYLGIVQQQCEDNHGCCWSSSNTDGVPWCFSMVDAPVQVCLSDQPRTDCGYLGIDQQGCHNIGCCWSPKDNEPYCFNKTAVDLSTKVCPTDESSRSDCGYLGIDQQKCEDNHGCCWSSSNTAGIPWCFSRVDSATAPSCDPSSPRRDCGHYGIEQQECLSQGCCWNPADNQPYCFNKTTPLPPTPTCLPDDVRFDCGYVGITQLQCEQLGCCYKQADGQPWCFYKTGGIISAQCKAQSPRYDCGAVGTTQESCERVGCCWDPKENEPYCFYQSPRYTVQSVTQTAAGVKITIATNGTSLYLPFGNNISPLTVEVTQETNDRLHIKIYDPNNQRWEVPTSAMPVPDPPSSAPASPKFTYQVAEVGEEFYFGVSRQDNSETLFNTSSFGTLQFGDRYISIGTSLPTGYNLYGLGERKSHLRLTTRNNGENCGNYYPLFNSDIPTIPENFNLYGSHPFYLDVRKGGLSHGVFLRNSDPMDVILSNDALQYKVIGGVLDFYFFLGPDPEAVVQQYTEVIGRPFMPPYWSLGFHQCRYGYESLQDLIDVVNGYNTSKIPLDTIWSDIDHMDGYKDFTLDPTNFPTTQVKEFVSKLHNNGLRYVVIEDPGIDIDPGYIPYDRGEKADIWLKDHNGNNFVGLVWPGHVHYPDFFNPKTDAYWKQEIQDFLKLVDVDGIWLDMNECANFCDGLCPSAAIAEKMAAIMNGEMVEKMSTGFDPNNPTYLINNRCFRTPLYTRTLAMDAQYYGGVLELDAHNIYGFMESISTYKALAAVRPNVRPFVLSRATFAGSGSYAAHWNGDNTADETDLYYSIPMMLSFQLFGMPFVGSDICGFFGDTTEELCARWMELGAFYPFARNHNFKGPIGQEPYRWPSVAAISRKVLGIRYSLLPYYYTLFYKAHRSVDSTNPPAATVIRPLFFEFPEDSNTYPIDWQFMLGSALLISPVLRVGDAGKQVSAYFPPAKWYDWFSYLVTSANGGESLTIATPIDHIPIHIRGGSVLALQGPGLNTEDSRSNNFSLLVALDSNGGAEGDVFLDDGVSINIASYTFVDYVVAGKQLTANVKGTGYASNLPPLDRVNILGVATQPATVTIDGEATSAFSYNSTSECLTVGPGLKIPMSQQFKLSWQ